MIAFLRGKILRLGTGDAIVDVQGVGYQVYASPTTLANLQVGETTGLEIFTVVREDHITLYGFATLTEREVFNLLLSANGVGPKIALSILTQTRLADLIAALRNENFAYLKNVKGLGEKTAKVLVATLKNKLDAFDVTQADLSDASENIPPAVSKEAEDALLGLGFSRDEVKVALASIPQGVGLSLEATIKASLRNLSQGGIS